ncbi:MAG: hypothetical protein L6R38_005826 [Xanthoria sp. 2 TBL-2021]|nr:MAG: hypothetical protein L6R38_005826 [Xanthoria sp. 2 TBL-2021]
MSNFSRSPSSRGSTTPSTSLTGTGRSSPVRGINGIARSARGSVKKPSQTLGQPNPSRTTSYDSQEADARAENASLMEELRHRVQKAESLSEEYQRQLQSLQSRLNHSLHDYGKLEDELHERDGKIADYENQAKLASRQRRELENNFAFERSAMLQDQSKRKAVEEELRAINQRLKDGLAERESRSPRLPPGTDNEDSGMAQPPPQPTISQQGSKEALQKDKLIESLRLELAGSQIKVMELENAGASRMPELEKAMMETRITNARLMEENESFQLLLSEKTLNGDFTKTEVMQPSHALGSLAEELESAEGESENYRRLESEAKALKDQNKALTLYIENIIGRLLSHKEFENVLEKSPDLMSSIARPGASNKDKELPPPPPAKEEEPAPSLLQRARSVVNGPRRPRPMSFMAASTAAPAEADEDASKSTSVPMARSQSESLRQEQHRRSQSEMPTMAAPIVNQMYRGAPSTGSGGPLSPGISPNAGIARNPFFASAAGTSSSNPTSRAPSGSRFSQERPGSSSNSTYSDKSGDASTKDKTKSGYTNYTGAVMTQNRLRPLRLVQENREMEGGDNGSAKAEETMARKKANRNSWLPVWFNKEKEDDNKGAKSGTSNFF